MNKAHHAWVLWLYSLGKLFVLLKIFGVFINLGGAKNE